MTKEVYLDVMKTAVKLWMVQVATETSPCYKQDGAPAHTHNWVQAWCDDNLNMF